MRQVTKQDFRQDVIDSRRLALVQFKTDWSGTCQIIAAIYEDLERAYKGIAEFFCVDVDIERELNDEYGIMELPTILIFRGGKVVDFAVGLTPKNVLITKIENALQPHHNSN